MANNETNKVVKKPAVTNAPSVPKKTTTPKEPVAKVTKPKTDSKPKAPALKKVEPKTTPAKKADPKAKVSTAKKVDTKATPDKKDTPKTKAATPKKTEPKPKVAAPKKVEPKAKTAPAKKAAPKTKVTTPKKVEPKKTPAKKATVAKPKAEKVVAKKPATKRAPRKLSPLQQQKLDAIRGYRQYEKVRNRYYSWLKRVVNNSKPTTDLYNTLANKKAEVSGITRNETKRFESDFIEEIERVIPSLEHIVVNPHKFISEFAEVVQVEKARRITPRAVKHMAQNVQNIAEVFDDGRIIPKRVLNVFVDDDLKIYENRFIMTLVRRLQIFIELRHKYIEDHGDTKNSDLITIKKEMKIGDMTFEFDGKVKMTIPSDDEGQRESNRDLLERLRSLRKRTMYLVSSPFMKEMVRAVPVADPIQQTNIIRLNYAYQDAYKLWLFINRYDELGITYTTTQAKVDFTDEYMQRLDQLTLNAFLSLETEHATIGPRNVKQKTIKPYVKAGQLDFDISDERFLEHGLPVKVSTRQETAEQKEARLKREAAREKARLKREAAKQKEKERKALLRARAKERAAKKKAAALERARIKRAEALERQKQKNLERARKRAEKERLLAERKAFQAKMADEARKLREARALIRKLAGERKKDEQPTTKKTKK